MCTSAAINFRYMSPPRAGIHRTVSTQWTRRNDMRLSVQGILDLQATIQDLKEMSGRGLVNVW